MSGWVPDPAPLPYLGWNPWADALYVILTRAPAGPTGTRLLHCMLACDPRTVVALADMIRTPVRR